MDDGRHTDSQDPRGREALLVLLAILIGGFILIVAADRLLHLRPLSATLSSWRCHSSPQRPQRPAPPSHLICNGFLSRGRWAPVPDGAGAMCFVGRRRSPS